MKATIEWMQAKFDEFNKEYFANSLRDVKLYVNETDRYRRYGYCSLKLKSGLNGSIRHWTRGKQMFYQDAFGAKTDIHYSNYRQFLNIGIHLYKDDEAPEYVLENILIHEMVHAYCDMSGFSCGHTGLFKEYARSIYDMSNGKYNITTYIDTDHCKQIKNDLRAAKYAKSNEKKAAKKAAAVNEAISKGILMFFKGANDGLTLGLYDKAKAFDCISAMSDKKNIYICLDIDILVKAANMGFKLTNVGGYYYNCDQVKELFDDLSKSGKYIEK